jgi:shikimate kinase
MMATRRVALVGHSGAGKSSCLLALGVDRKLADMDAVLGTTHPGPSLVTALEWLADDKSAPQLVVVSNHERMLLQMRQAKLRGQFANKFARVLLVYLHTPKDQLCQQLSKPTADGRARPPEDQQYTLEHYDRFHELFTQLADLTVNCAARSVADLATLILSWFSVKWTLAARG